MNRDRPICVVDTNTLIDYIDIIPDPNDPERLPENANVDLGAVHIVIPLAVIHELAKFAGKEKEMSYRVAAAREILNRLEFILEGFNATMSESYNLNAAITGGFGGRMISIMPLCKKFLPPLEMLDFEISGFNMDGKILGTALAAKQLWHTGESSGEGRYGYQNYRPGYVTLLTRDRELADTAIIHGIQVLKYHHDLPKPYTGRREVIVPPELFAEFFKEGRLELDIWQMFMPDEPDLVANEFVVMKLENPREYPEDYDPWDDRFFRYIARYDLKEQALVKLEHVHEFWVRACSDGQAMYIESLMHPDITAIHVTGPAGTGKTFLAVVYGYESCRKWKYLSVKLVPPNRESDLGALPGDIDDKMAIDTNPIRNALFNYLLKFNVDFRKEFEKARRDNSEIKDEEILPDETGKKKLSLKQRIEQRVKAIWEFCFENLPVDGVRGADFEYALAIFDEGQDFTIGQAHNLATRLNDDAKMIFAGDIRQIHATGLNSYHNGLTYIGDQFYGLPKVARVTLYDEECVRNDLVRELLIRQRDHNS